MILRLLFLASIFFAAPVSYSMEGGDPTSLPYVGAIIAVDKPGVPNFGIACSATLVHKDWVLTDAGCTEYFDSSFQQHDYAASDLKVILGEFSNGNIGAIDFNHPNAISVTQIVRHPGREDFVFDNDSGEFYDKNSVALLKLANSQPSITPVTLYSGSDLFLSGNAVEVGWVSEINFIPSLSSDYSVNSLDVPLATTYNTAECVNNAIPYNICGGLQSTVSYTDSRDIGGPLLREIDLVEQQIGVLHTTNFGFDPVYDNFTRISSVKAFIDTTITPPPSIPADWDETCVPIASGNKTTIICLSTD